MSARCAHPVHATHIDESVSVRAVTQFEGLRGSSYSSGGWIVGPPSCRGRGQILLVAAIGVRNHKDFAP
jgi:hypothetical protein